MRVGTGARLKLLRAARICKVSDGRGDAHPLSRFSAFAIAPLIAIAAQEASAGAQVAGQSSLRFEPD